MVMVIGMELGTGLKRVVSILDEENIGFHDIQIENIEVDGFTISIDALIKPVHALRMIEVDIFVPPRTFSKAMPMVYSKINQHSSIKKFKMGHQPFFKNEYDRIGFGKYVFK